MMEHPATIIKVTKIENNFVYLTLSSHDKKIILICLFHVEKKINKKYT